MIYEKHVGTLAGLRRELEVLDGDAGVRVEGKYGGKRCVAFVTRFEKTYTAIVFSAKGASRRNPGKRLASDEFADLDSVMLFLTPMARPRIDAYVY